MRRLQAAGLRQPRSRAAHAELDLTDERATRAFFEAERPEYVFLAAAKVGGIVANNSYPAEFIRDNLAIQTNVIHAAWQRRRASACCSWARSCIYPQAGAAADARRSYLLTGPLEPTNRPYALAKIAGIEMCWRYNRQYGTQLSWPRCPPTCTARATTTTRTNSHVHPGADAQVPRGQDSAATQAVTVWGTGTPRREFLYSDDMADACVFLMNLPGRALRPRCWAATRA